MEQIVARKQERFIYWTFLCEAICSCKIMPFNIVNFLFKGSDMTACKMGLFVKHWNSSALSVATRDCYRSEQELNLGHSEKKSLP